MDNERTALGQDAEDDLADVLASDVASVATVETADRGADLRVSFRDGTTLLVEVKAAAHPTPSQLDRMLQADTHPDDVVHVLVGDFLSQAVRDKLAGAGWGFLDRRGHLFLNAPGKQLEVSVPPRPRQGLAVKPGIRGSSGIAVAYAHLLEPDLVLGVRELARAAGLASPTSVSTARRSLQDANLLEPDGRAVIPELFWALAAHWALPLDGLAAVVKPEDLEDHGQNTSGPFAGSLQELADAAPEAGRYAGAALGGDLAALLYGAPVVRGANSPFDLYLNGAVVISRLKRRFGESQLTERAVGVRSFPVSVVARTRRPPRPGSDGFALVHPLVVALDLAQDRARGIEILDGWTPEDYRRVW